jgi:hypothetical protein
LRLRDRDRDLKRLLGRRGVGRFAVQQDLGADAVHLGFIRALSGDNPCRGVAAVGSVTLIVFPAAARRYAAKVALPVV